MSIIIEVKVNNIVVQTTEGSTILDVAHNAGENIPTLCRMKLHNTNSEHTPNVCKICLVEVAGEKDLLPACSTKVAIGMEIFTRTASVMSARRNNLESILKNHPQECLTCKRNLKCELQTLAAEFGIKNYNFEGVRQHSIKDNSNTSISRNTEKCILCRRCETVCKEVQSVGVYSAQQKDAETVIATAFDSPLNETTCTFCGQCVMVCPTAALEEIDDTAKVWEVLYDPDKFVVVQTAPAIRVSLGECFGLPAGTQVTGKMITALRLLGFNQVLDTAFGADLTVMEEAHEFLHRLKNGGKLPIITTCCCSWTKSMEHQYPDMLDLLSTCKSPHQMFGAIAKSYLPEKLKIDPKKMVVVSVMPCLSKKFEVSRNELSNEQYGQDVDYVISTRELTAMIKKLGLDFKSLPDSDFDKLMGETTAGVIFGTTGGVMESVIRTAATWLDGKTPDNIDFIELRGNEGIREAKVTLGGKEYSLAIAHGLSNARKLIEDIRGGKKDYHAVEIMASPYGCVGGGGQPYYGNNECVLQKRSQALHREEEGKPRRMSHENKEIQELYSEFLGDKGGKKAHELLHTFFKERK